MTFKPNLKIEHLDISTIQIDEAERRAVSEETVQDIVSSAQTYGTILDPIKVRKARRKGGDRLDLMDGAHRIAACKKLGWTTIPALVWVDIPDAAAKLIEFDANIARNEPDAFERCFTVWQRKKIYDELHPEAARGVAGALARWNATDMMSVAPFSTSTAEIMGVSERQIRRLVEAVSTFSEDELRALRHAKTRVNVSDLKKLSAVMEPDDRRFVIGQLSAGHAASLGEALSKLSKKPTAKDPEVEAYQKLKAAWERTPMKMKRRFVADESAELLSLLKDLDREL